MFGPRTEKASQVLGEGSVSEQSSEESRSDDAGEGEAAESSPPQAGSGQASDKAGAPKEKRKGHGRNGSADYVGAERTKVAHDKLHHKDRCPECLKGKVYLQSEPKSLVRLHGMARIVAKVYELETLRCNLCNEVFHAPSPEGVGDAKYDESATAMIGVLKYGCGVPLNRLDMLEQHLGIPLPASTQWELLDDAAKRLAPAHAELMKEAAQGDVLYNDDTKAKIVKQVEQVETASPPAEQGAAREAASDGRTGTFTSGVVSTKEGRKIALYFTGNKHAGENLASVLTQRASELPPPIQMCDGLSSNTAGDFETIVANCLAHARRKFVEIVNNFPDDCKYLLERLSVVYKNDKKTQQENMSPEQRLVYHQTHSGPLMSELEKWFTDQLDGNNVEPNSGLGAALRYMKKHWSELTLFLRHPDAPLDNNLCERALKKAILHRKNAYFYRTHNGARAADIFMSLIHTVELAGGNPFDYLVTLLRHHDEVRLHPHQWMPWNYREATLPIADQPPPPS